MSQAVKSEDLQDTLALLQDYDVQAHLDEDVRRFAEGEAYGDDPIQTRYIVTVSEGD